MHNVIKIGSSILSSFEVLDSVASQIAKKFKNDPVVIVVSAIKGETQKLINLCDFLDETPSEVITVGEQIAAGLFAAALRKHSLEAVSLNAYQIPILTTSMEEGSTIRNINKSKLIGLLKQGIIPVVTGYQGVSDDMRITNFKRGGSDLSAVAIAKELNGTCFLIKDTGGIYSADPKKVNKPILWNSISYQDMLCLSNIGCQVVQKDAALFARAYSVSMMITNLDFNMRTNISLFSGK